MANRSAKKGAPVLATRLALSMPEAAAALGVSERYLRSVRAHLPLVYLGDRPMIPVDALKRWLEDRATGGDKYTDSVADEILGKLSDDDAG